MSIVAPSLLAADFGNLEKEIKMINESAADWLHLDIMDGVFVPNISFGFPVIEAINALCNKPLDVHLMTVNPEQYIKRYKDVGAYLLNVHYEACAHLHRTVQQIKEEGMKAGVTLNPHTPIEVLTDIVRDVDLVQIMSVNPGFGGQKFIEHTYGKVKRLKQMIVEANTETLIEVDGGVNLDNAPKLVEAGVDVLVAGTTVFKASDPQSTIVALQNC